MYPRVPYLGGLWVLVATSNWASVSKPGNCIETTQKYLPTMHVRPPRNPVSSDLFERLDAARDRAAAAKAAAAKADPDRELSPESQALREEPPGPRRSPLLWNSFFIFTII